MTISPVPAYPAYSIPAPVTNYNTTPASNINSSPVLQQSQSAANISPNAKGEPDLVCSAQYDARTKVLQLSSFERGWMDSNIWYSIKADGSGEAISAWGVGAQYPAGTFSNVLNKAQSIYYTQGKISEETALDLVKDTRATVDVARQNGKENFIKNGLEAIMNGTMSIS